MIQSINLYITNLTYIEETKNIDIYKYVVEKYKVGNQSRATVHGRCRISLKPLSYGSLFFQSTIGNLALIHSSSGLKIKRVLDVNLNCIDGGGSLFLLVQYIILLHNKLLLVQMYNTFLLKII